MYIGHSINQAVIRNCVHLVYLHKYLYVTHTGYLNFISQCAYMIRLVSLFIFICFSCWETQPSTVVKMLESRGQTEWLVSAIHCCLCGLCLDANFFGCWVPLTVLSTLWPHFMRPIKLSRTMMTSSFFLQCIRELEILKRPLA